MISRVKEKTCESCGQVFLCNQGDCWCDAIQLSPPALRALQDQFKECLCESCLRAMASRQTGK